MTMSINTNAGAEVAAVAAQRASAMMDEAMLRLSTGKRINSAKDDAAGLAVATRMAREIAGLSQSLRNANDAQGLIDTGESALKEVHTLLLRMREIAVSASSDSSSRQSWQSTTCTPNRSFTAISSLITLSWASMGTFCSQTSVSPASVSTV